MIPTDLFASIPLVDDELTLLLSDSEDIVQYFGHIGYGVHPLFRGHRYAARACRLVLPVLAHHDIDPIWITCNPDNVPSRRTCELIGAELINIVDLRRTSISTLSATGKNAATASAQIIPDLIYKGEENCVHRSSRRRSGLDGHLAMAARHLRLFCRRTPQRPINSRSFMGSAHETKNLKPPPTFY